MDRIRNQLQHGTSFTRMLEDLEKVLAKLKHENKKDKKRLGNLDIEDLDAEYRAIVE